MPAPRTVIRSVDRRRGSSGQGGGYCFAANVESPPRQRAFFVTAVLLTPPPVTGRRRAWLAGAGLVLVGGPVWWFTGVLAGTPPPIIAIGATAAACWTIVARVLDPRRRQPLRVILATFLWGSVVAACISAQVNDILLAWAGSGARNPDLVPVVLGPVVEEGAKAAALIAALLLARDELRSPLDGIVYGALVGIGFAMTENFSYLTLAALQGGPAGLWRGVYLRAVLGGPVHATFTAMTGAGLVQALLPGRVGVRLVAAAAGFVAAVGEHVIWNGIASRTLTGVLCGPQYPGACLAEPETRALVVQAPLVVALFLGPGILMLLAIGRLSSRRR
jgi:protease PrsW